MLRHIYGPKGYFNFKDSYKLDIPLSFETVKNGMIYLDKTFLNEEYIAFYNRLHHYGVILDENNKYVLAAANHRHPLGSRSEEAETVFPQEPVRRHKKAIYLGCIIRHWGHFLVEGISRWWFLLNDEQYKDYELCYMVYEQQRDYISKIMDLFGLDKSRLHKIECSTIYDELIIPEASTEFEQFWSEEYKNTIKQITKNVKPIYNRRIYLSRQKFGDHLLGEKVFAKTFKRNGYKIIYPERLSIEKQIALMKGAEEIACISGTTAHNLIFASDKTRCTILERSTSPNIAQLILNDMNNLDVSHVKASFSFLPTADGYGPFLVGITPFVEQYFKDNQIKYKLSDCQFHQQFIQTYQRLWLCNYHDEKGFKLIIFNYPKTKISELQQIKQTLEEELKDQPLKIKTDKKIKDIEKIKPSRFRLIYKVKNGRERKIYFCGICIRHYEK